jgi:hypothetical protein
MLAGPFKDVSRNASAHGIGLVLFRPEVRSKNLAVDVAAVGAFGFYGLNCYRKDFVSLAGTM